MNFSRIGIFFLIAVFWTATPLESTAAANAQAGWAEVEITPPLGIALGGRGGPTTLSNKVLDPLFAQVLILKGTNGTGFVLVSLDIVGITHELGDRIRTAIVHETGVPWNLIVLNCSHTHSGPYTIRSVIAGLGSHPKIETDYFDTLTGKIISAAREANRTLKDVTVEVFNGKSDVGINRRNRNKQGKMTMLPNANAPYDEKVWILKLTPQNNTAPTVIFSYACHPVIAYGYNYAAISADYPGVARNELRKALGAKTHTQFVQGFAGNIRPRVVADLQNNRFRASKPEDLQRAGKDLADAILTAMKSTGEKLSLNIAGAMDHPFLPRTTPPPPTREYYEQMRTNSIATTNSFRLAVAEYWLQRYNSGDGFAKGDAWALGLIRLADNQWIIHAAGEPVVEWRAKISDWLAPRKIVTFGYAEARSYVPTENLLPELGYEVLESNEARASTPAPYAPGIEKAARESLLRQLAFIESKVK
jgi:neutral ceramidase